MNTNTNTLTVLLRCPLTAQESEVWGDVWYAIPGVEQLIPECDYERWAYSQALKTHPGRASVHVS